MKRLITAGTVCALLSLGAPLAHAATRYASPGGIGPESTCPRSNPCEIHAAVDGVSVSDGDTVILLPGTYSVGGTAVSVNHDITVRGEPGQPRPLITATTANALVVFHAGALIEEMRLESNGAVAGFTLNAQAAATMQHLEVTAFGMTPTAAQLRNGALLRNSFLRSLTPGGNGVVTGGTGAHLRNVTAIATGTASSGLSASAAFGDPQTVTLRNTIVRGAGNGIFALGNGDADVINIHVSYSNYSSASALAADATITLGPGNQTAAPLFANAAAGDFHQRLGSPTINAGSPDALTGSTDLDGQPRIMRGRLDIGADEYPEHCGGLPATVFGNSSRNVLRGTPGRDRIFAGGGNDVVRALGGNDVVCGGGGKDKLIGGGGKDTLRGEAGADTLKGGGAKDKLFGGPGRDRLFGGPGRDKLAGGAAPDLQRQ